MRCCRIQHGVLLDRSGEFMIQETGEDMGIGDVSAGDTVHAKEWHGRFQVCAYI